VSSEIAGSSTANRPAHHIYILRRPTIVNEIVVKINCVLFNGVGDKSRAAFIIMTVSWILDSEECYVETLYDSS
jgi:hypothetical protein